MSQQRESRFFRAWARMVLRLRWVVVPVLVVVTALAAMEVRSDLIVETSPEYFAKGSSDAYETLDAFREDFGRDDQYLVMVRGEVFSRDFLDRLTALHHAIETEPMELSDDAATTAAEPAPVEAGAAAAGDGWGDDDGWGDGDDWGVGDGDGDWAGEAGGSIVEQVVSLVNFRQTVFEGGGLRVRGLMDQQPTDLAAFKRQVLADDTIVGSVVGAQGKHAVIAVRTELISDRSSRDVLLALQRLGAEHSQPGFDVVVTGLPALEHAVSGTLMRDMRNLVGLVFLLMGAVLFLLFRHPVAVIAPLVVVGMSIIWTLGAMAATGTPVTLLTNIVPAFLVCVGLGDSVHVQTVYRDLRAHGVDQQEAIISSVGSTGMPVLFTTLTTMIGLLSFLTASTQGIRELGLTGALGVFCALTLSVTVIPLAARLIGAPKARQDPQRGRSHDTVDALLRACTRMSEQTGGRRRVLVGALVLAVLAGVGISQVVVFHDPLTWLPTGHPVQTSIRELDSQVGGTSNVSIVLDAPGELGVKDRDLLVAMEALEADVQAFTHPRTGAHIVGNSTSLLMIVKETNRALHEGVATAYALPADQRGVSDNLLLFESASPQALRRVATADLKKTHLSFRLDWMDATSLLPLADHVYAAIDRNLGSLIEEGRVEATVTGAAYSLVTTVGALLIDMIRSFGVAVGIIAVMMGTLLRSGKLALVALLPNLLPVGMVLGFMGFTGIPIDMATLLIASIVIGIAVDNTIHYLHQYRVAWLSSGDREASIRHALDHAGRALVGTAIILAMGFGAYLASQMANIQRFGVLVAAACGFALFSNLILVPALLRIFYGDAHVAR